MAVLVTGGAGYIGSVTVEMLRARNIDVAVLDNLVCGHAEAVDDDVPFYRGSVGDADLVKQIVRDHGIGSCIHFAGYALVGESTTNPSKYFENNTVETTRLLDALIGEDVKKFVFSSTCATYGDPLKIPIDETHSQQPVNPYGWSKFMTERILEAYAAAYGLQYVSLRYFNAAGATQKHGEHHDPETHLIPNVLAAATGERPFVPVFGTEYPTPDGTCIRDYIHVADLGAAHIRAVEYLEDNQTSTHINLGSGIGFSVLEVIEAARKITGKSIEAKVEPRRAGDPAELIADSDKALKVLGVQTEYSDLENIIRSAWNWKQRHPDGYDQPREMIEL